MTVDDFVIRCLGCGKYDRPEEEREGILVQNRVMSETCYINNYRYDQTIMGEFYNLYHRAETCEDLYE